eukprot:SAG31_NODE_2141_length_6344_cov_13.577742_4_plen_97_part_00
MPSPYKWHTHGYAAADYAHASRHVELVNQGTGACTYIVDRCRRHKLLCTEHQDDHVPHVDHMCRLPTRAISMARVPAGLKGIAADAVEAVLVRELA